MSGTSPIVGAGPVGIVAACELARRGVPIRVFDKLVVAHRIFLRDSE